MTKLLILAGGYGTRLYPVVKDTPKALLEVAGKTLIDHTLDKFKAVDEIEEVVVVTNAKFAGMMSGWAKARDGRPFPVRIVDDGTHTPEERLGAIGDVLFVIAKEQVVCDWIVAGSDNLFDYQIQDFLVFAKSVRPAVMIGCYDLEDIAGAVKYGVIELAPDGRVLSLEEKPKAPKTSLISMCLYSFPAESLARLKAFVDETHNVDTTGGYIQWLYQKQSVYGFKFSGKWYDIGSIESYNEAQKSFRS